MVRGWESWDLGIGDNDGNAKANFSISHRVEMTARAISGV